MSISPKAAVRAFLSLAFALAVLTNALAQMPNPYGLPISLENAKKVAAPALAEAAKNNWTVAVAIVGPAGNLIYDQKMDNTQLGSADVAIEKARTSALFKRPTKVFQDALAAGGDWPARFGLAQYNAGRGWPSAHHGWKNRRSDRRLGRHKRAGCSVRQGRRRYREINDRSSFQPLDGEPARER